MPSFLARLGLHRLVGVLREGEAVNKQKLHVPFFRVVVVVYQELEFLERKVASLTFGSSIADWFLGVHRQPV